MEPGVITILQELALILRQKKTGFHRPSCYFKV